MQASRVTFTHETKQRLMQPGLTKKAKQAIRKERVLEYIRSKPNGDVFKMTQLIEAAGYDANKQYASGWAYVNGLIKKKTFIAEKIPNSHEYEIYLNDTPVKQMKPPKADDIQKIIIRAKDFAWENDSDSLRAFIKSLEVEHGTK